MLSAQTSYSVAPRDLLRELAPPSVGRALIKFAEKQTQMIMMAEHPRFTKLRVQFRGKRGQSIGLIGLTPTRLLRQALDSREVRVRRRREEREGGEGDLSTTRSTAVPI